MKKNNTLKIVLIVLGAVFLFMMFLLIAGGVVLFLIFKNQEEKPIKINDDFVFVEESEYQWIDENIVYTSYEDFYDDFHSHVLTRQDFQNHNYILIPMSYDPCSESDLTPTDYTSFYNKYYITVKYTASCGVCAPSCIYYLLKVDKSRTSAVVSLDYEAVNNPHCDPNVSYKPLIYLYPEKETSVTVKLGYPDRLTTTYPSYNGSWNFVVKPNGEIRDRAGRTYYGLYWEGYNYIADDFDDGFVVKKEDTAKFLEEKLLYLGLNDREANEFIIYWLPKLEQNEYNFIRFESLEKINEQMPLTINPKPDTLIRILMEYKPLDHKVSVKEQQLTSPVREGFTVVEWGGSLIQENENITH